MRKEVLAEFCRCDSSIRLLIASTAFGLGFDCKDINRIINYATPNTFEELVQVEQEEMVPQQKPSYILKL